MYDNSGRKIMRFASILTALMIIMGVVFGLTVWLVVKGIGGFIAGLIIIGVTALSAWIANLLLYGFGELVYKTSQIEEILRTNPAEAGPRTNSPQATAAKSSSGFHSSPISTPKAAPARPSGPVTCPFCKRVYPAGTVFCTDCNAQIGSR